MEKFSLRRAICVIIGNLIIGFFVALLKLSGMGNDPFGAMNMALSEGFSLPVGHLQLIVNIILLTIQLIFGRKFLGFGSVVNLFFLGYIVQYSLKLLYFLLGNTYEPNLFLRIVIMAIALLGISFGLSMYQLSALGVSPYDYLSIGMTDRFKNKYFLNRIITDMACIAIILTAFAVGIVKSNQLNLGVGTIIAAFGLGPFVAFFNKINQKIISPSKDKTPVAERTKINV